MASKWVAIGKTFFWKTLDLAHFSRCAAWYFSSTKEYTKSAYLKKSESFRSFEDVDVQGKSFMVLGATGTLGTAVSEYLAKKDGITLYLLFRNAKSGDELIQKIKPTAGKDTKLIPTVLDFTDVSKVREFIDGFIASKHDLHVLINCCHMATSTQEKDEYGTSKTFLINVVSPYIFVSKFAEYFSAVTDPAFKKRIINCTCGYILTVSIRVGDIELKKIPFKPLFHFSHEKKQNSVSMNFLSTKYPAVHFANVIPGWFESSIHKQVLPDVAKSLMSDLRTPQQAVDTILWAALTDEALNFKSGEVFLDRALYKLTYLNQPNFLKKTIMAVYLKSLQIVLDKYEMIKPVEKTDPKTSETEKSEEPEVKKESKE